jgi:hypothetical protein
MCLLQQTEMFIYLMSKSCGLPTQWLIGVEFFIPCSGRDDAIVLKYGDQVGQVAFGGVFYPSLVGVGNYYYLMILFLLLP